MKNEQVVLTHLRHLCNNTPDESFQNLSCNQTELWFNFMSRAISFPGKLFLRSRIAAPQHHHPPSFCHFYLSFLPSISRTTVYSGVFKCLPRFLRCVCICVHFCVCVCMQELPSFIFNFACVYPADSLQSVDKEAAMKARGKMWQNCTQADRKIEIDGCQLWTTLRKQRHPRGP